MRKDLHEANRRAVQDFKNPHPGYEFLWTIAGILTAVLDAGLVLKVYPEYPYANGAKLFRDMRELDGRRMVPPAGQPNLPLMFALVVEKAA